MDRNGRTHLAVHSGIECPSFTNHHSTFNWSDVDMSHIVLKTVCRGNGRQRRWDATCRGWFRRWIEKTVTTRSRPTDIICCSFTRVPGFETTTSWLTD